MSNMSMTIYNMYSFLLIIVNIVCIIIRLPREDAGVLSREYVLRIPACRKRRLKGRRYIAIVADTA